MSSTELFTPDPPSLPRRVVETVTIPAPPEHEEKPRMKLFQLALVVGVPAIMLGMMILMFQSGMRTSPMMMIMPVMMIVSMVSGTLLPMISGGDEGRDLDSDRQNYFADLANKRRSVHVIARSQHAVQKALYPSPHSLVMLIRNRDSSMWSALPPEAVGSVEMDSLLAAEGSEQSGSNYGNARAGVGLMLLDPPVETDNPASVSPDHLEPVTYGAHTNFLATQNIVANSPLPVRITYPVIGLRGADIYRNDLVRGFVTSLAYSTSPTYMMIAVVAAPDNTEWDWIKWLPHNANVFEDTGPGGFPTMRWSSFSECARYLSSKHPLLVQHHTRMVVIVDDPAATLTFPRGMDETSLPNVTFLIVRAHKDEAITRPEHNFHISADRGYERSFSAFDARDIAVVDTVPRALAEDIAREMSALRPPGFGKRELVDSSSLLVDTAVADAPTVMDALGVADLENYNVPARWRATDTEKTFKAPLGFKVNARNEPTGDLVYLDVLQLVSGGTGPHGLFSGGTGTGKSFLLRMYVLMMATLYSPNRLTFIFMDFKGGSTFLDLMNLPHALATMTNLENAQDVVARAKDVIQGENERRQEIFQRVGVGDIQEYRKLRETRPDLEVIPDLMIIADETREFLEHRPEYRKVFQQIAAVGRSTGLHLLIGSQYLDQGMLGDIDNYTYGFSLKVKSGSSSNTVVRDQSAAELPPTKVGILWYSKLQDEYRERFQGFDHSQPYVIRADAGDVIDHDDSEPVRSHDFSAGAEVASFTQTGFSGIEQREDVAATRYDSAEAAERAADTVTDKTQFQAVFDMVMEQSAGYTQVRQLWAESLSTPMTFAALANRQDEMRPPEGGGVSIRLGDIDQPFAHRRIPMEKVYTSQTGNLAIVGAVGTGKSTVLKSLIASSGVRYTGRHVAWFVHDYAGTALADMEHYPNVAIYAPHGDEDGWRRITGEVRRLIELRTSVMREHRITSIDEYFNRREELGVASDPYTYVMVAFDGLDRFYDDNQMENLDAVVHMARLLTDAPAAGIFFNATFSAYKASTRIDRFGHGVRLFVPQVSDTFQGLGNQALRDKFQEMPGQEPGRVIDTSVTDSAGRAIPLHGRVLLPIGQSVEPLRVDNGVPVYPTTQDYSARIREFGESLSKSTVGQAPAPKLRTPGSKMDLGDILSAVDVDAYRNRPAHKRVIPFGVDAGTFMPSVIDLSKGENHVIVSGSDRSGKTSTLRSFMHSIATMYSPDEARFIVLDSTQALLDDVEGWVERGYMRPDSYSMTKSSSEAPMKRLEVLMQRRLPDEDEVMKNPRMIANRSYFTGPEIFVIVNDAEVFLSAAGSYSAGKSPLESAILALTPQDVGVHFVLGLGADQLPTYISGNKSILHLVETQSPEFLLHSGPNVGALIMGTRGRFKTLIPGRVQRFARNRDSASLPQAQVGFVPAPTPPDEMA